jgi:outer membrane receptor protein involved in Fe transport
MAGLAGGAEAADARHRFSIPPKAYTDALIDLGLQAQVSILGASNCGPGGRAALSGRHDLAQALQRLLRDAPCRAEIVDARTVRIIAAATATRPEPAREVQRPPSLVSEVVVTATKRTATLDRLPAGVSAIPRGQITTTRALDVGQTVGQLAGVLSTNLGPGRDKLLIRGLSDGAFTGRTRSTVGTYLDDAPINYNAPDPDLRLVDIERVEVVRGPQGALYGSGALAGIYRIVTAKPDSSAIAAGVSVTGSLTQGGDASREFDGYLNIPVVRDRIAVRLVAYEEVQGGYLDNVSLGLANVDKTRRDGGRVAVRVDLDDGWRLDALAATQHLRTNDTQYVIARMGGAAGPPRRANEIREAHNNDFSYAGATLNGEFPWGSLTSSTSYVHHVFSSQYDASLALEEIFNAPTTDLGAYVEATRSSILVQDLVVRSRAGREIDWLFGVYGARSIERTPSRLSLLSAQGVTPAYDEFRKDRLTEFAVYGEASYGFGEGWTATLGGRVFESQVHTTADIRVVGFLGSRFQDQRRTFKGFSPKIALQREFTNGDLVYALVSEGYRPGGFNSSGFFPIRPQRSTFAQDRLRNFEVGAKLRRMDGRLAMRAAAYYDDWAGIQTDQYRTSGLSYTANVGDASIAGIEAEIAYDWDFGLSVQLNGNLADSRIRNPNFDFATQILDQLPGVPTASGGLLAVYERPVGEALTLRLVGQASYVGRSALSFDATLPSRSDSYLRARISAEVASDAWRVTAFVTNPLDVEGDTFAYGNPFSFGEVRQVTPQRPRTVGLRLAAAF